MMISILRTLYNYLIVPIIIIFLISSLVSNAYARDINLRSTINNLSSYMMTPLESWVPNVMSRDPNVTMTKEYASDGKLGFRFFHLRSSVQGKKQAAVDLASSTVVQTGDILLSFRPLWDKTLAYAHMQLGISHSGLAFVVSDAEERFVMTLESPISYSSPLNAPEHYADLNAIHIIRPTLSNTQKQNLEKWARLLFAKKNQFNFFSDYSKPMYLRGIDGVVKPKDQIEYLARLLLDANESIRFESFCSEFVWSFLGLRNCEPNSYDKTCIVSIFNTLDGMLTGLTPQIKGNAGLVQGPEATLISGKFADKQRNFYLTNSIFVDVLSDSSQLAGRMSSGHLKVAKDNSQGMKLINQYYANGESKLLANQINGLVINNVSPTAFLLRSNSKLDGLSYVGTVVFDKN